MLKTFIKEEEQSLVAIHRVLSMSLIKKKVFVPILFFVFLLLFALQDVADSRRINTNIREEEARLPPEEQPALALSAMILSSEFWPPLKDERMELPAVVTQAMETYTHRYEKLKVGGERDRGRER